MIQALKPLAHRIKVLESLVKKLMMANECNIDTAKITEEVFLCQIAELRANGDPSELRKVSLRRAELVEKEKVLRLKYHIQDQSVVPPFSGEPSPEG